MRMVGNIALAASIALLGSACQAPAPHELSRGHVTESGPARASGIPAPVRQSPFVPPPATRQARETYTVVVSEVPVKALLFALARDAGVDADIHPSVEGLVTLNAIDQPLDAILDRITAQLDIRSRRRNGVLVIEPDTPVLRRYRIDYVNVAREVRSRSSTATQVSAGGEGEASLGNNSSTDIDSLSSHRFWETIAAAVRAIVLERDDTGGAAAPEAEGPPEAEGAPTAGPPSIAPEPGPGSAVIPNPEAGILLVRTTARRHREVEAYLDDVLASARRQVLVETTIVEVELSERFQAGVDWERLARNDGIGASQRLLAGNLETPPFFALSYRSGSLGLTVRLLEEFGKVQVLSSPKLVVLNNQTAVLKAMRNIVYFEVNVETASGTDTTPGTARIDTDARTAPEGIMLAVTPHVSHADEIILNVRPTITRVNRFVNDPQPELAAAGVANPVPELLVREMESVLRLNSGQTAILGGLMQDSHRGDNDRIPGLSDVDRFGAAFRFRKSESVKTELVVFIRPRVIRTPSVEEDLRDFRSWLPGATGAFGATHPSADPQPLVGEQP